MASSERDNDNSIDSVTILDKKNNKSIELKVFPSTVGPDVIDVRGLYRDLNYFTDDPGFTSTASCDSAITFIDGEKGILLHRGYSIEELASNSDFLEVAYLLMEGELPDKNQRIIFDAEIEQHTMLHEQLIRFDNGFRRDAHPMAILVGFVGVLSGFYLLLAL